MLKAYYDYGIMGYFAKEYPRQGMIEPSIKSSLIRPVMPLARGGAHGKMSSSWSFKRGPQVGSADGPVGTKSRGSQVTYIVFLVGQRLRNMMLLL